MNRLPLWIAVLVLVGISVIPMGRTLVRSVQTTPAPGQPAELTLEHYHEAFVPGPPIEMPGGRMLPSPASSNWRLLGNSLGIAGLAALLAVLIGVPYAVLVTRTDIPGKGFLSWIYLVPLVLPPLLTAVSWSFIPAFEPAPLTGDSAGDPEWGGVIAVLRAGAMFALCYFPLVVLFARRALQRVPAPLEEAARVAGGPWAALRGITLPLIAPGTLAGALFVFLFALNDFSLVDFLNWVRPTADRINVYPFRSFTAWRESDGEAAAVALGLPIAIAGIVLLLGIHRLIGRGHRASVATSFRPAKPFELGAGRWAALAGISVLLVVSVGIPLYGLLSKAGGIDSYRAIWKLVAGANSTTDEVAWTMWHAALAATLAAPLAFVLAHRVARRRSPWVFVLALLPLAMPPIFLGIGALRTYGGLEIPLPGGGTRNPFVDPDSPRFGSTLVLVAKYLPFALAALWAAFLEIDPRLEEAAAAAGVKPLDRVLGIALPLARPALGLAFVLVFVFSLREIDTLVLLDSAGVMRKIYTAVHFTRDSQVAALCVILIAMQAIPFLVLHLLVPRSVARGAA
jgi:iron(III) transport system permease protein